MKNKILFFFTAMICGISIKAKAAAENDSLIKHVDSAINILKTHSLYSKRIEWKKVEKKVYSLAKGKKTKAETFDALKVAFEALGDKHAVFYHYNNQFRIDNAQLNLRYSDSLKAEWKKGPKIISKMLNDQAYLRVPYIGANNQQDIDKMAETINKAVQLLSINNPKGWIIDLRLNAGGNIRPMMAGLASFFKDGVLGYYLDRNGKSQERSSIEKRKYLIDGKVQAVLSSPIEDLSEARVAVLIGPGTGSSGEALAVNFKARAKTALFGQPTAGLANSTDGFVFSDNNAYFLISVSRLGDRNKKVLPEEVLPQYNIAPNDHFSDLPNDSVTRAARIWLSKSVAYKPLKKSKSK